MDKDVSLIKMEGICKRFGGVTALEGMEFELRSGEIHALLGENGAGKSTLIKILSGVYAQDSGSVFLYGSDAGALHPAKSRDMGIAAVYQELSLVNGLTVAENIFLGHIPSGPAGHVRRRELRERAQALLDYVGISCDPDRKIEELGVAQQQMVEIAKALSSEPNILIMDEPTDKLYGDEQAHLFEILKKLKDDGKGIVYISHKLEELFVISDRITVLRDGRYIQTVNTADTDDRQLIQLMVGRSIEDLFPKEMVPAGDEAIRVEGLCFRDILKDIHFTAYRGEILGIGGLVGAGRSLLAKCIAGIVPADSGCVYMGGEVFRPASPRDAIRRRLVYLPEDRKQYGLLMNMSCLHNIMIPSLHKLLLKKQSMESACGDLIRRLNVKTASLDERVQNLSGGNQQKVVIAKWIYTKADVFIFDEPTQGIDVGTKAEIYKLMNALVRDGACILMISSDMRELLAMSDRIMVMNRGRVSEILRRSEATQEKILSRAIESQS